MIRFVNVPLAPALLVAFFACQLASAAPADQQPSAASSAQEKPPAAAPADDDALPSPDQLWDVNMLRCSNWLDAADDDRAVVRMFYYGWLAGSHGIHAVRPAAIQPNLRTVLDYCAQHRDTTIVKAFEATLLARKR
ncbi:MAG: HdeA/HdeB family chaperone [Rhodopila sp.]